MREKIKDLDLPGAVTGVAALVRIFIHFDLDANGNILDPLQLRLEPSTTRGLAKVLRLRCYDHWYCFCTVVLLYRTTRFEVSVNPFRCTQQRRRLCPRLCRVRLGLLRCMVLLYLAVRSSPTRGIAAASNRVVLARSTFRMHCGCRYWADYSSDWTTPCYDDRAHCFHSRDNFNRDGTNRSDLLGSTFRIHNHHTLGNGYVLSSRNTHPIRHGEERASRHWRKSC